MVFLSDRPIPLVSAPKLADRTVGRLPASIEAATLRLGDVTVECHVLDTGDHVLTLRSAVEALTGKAHGNMGEIVRMSGLKSFIDADSTMGETVEFFVPRSPNHGRAMTADTFVNVCQAFASALSQGKLRTPVQVSIAIRACVLVAACAKVGLEALIAEATGYQYSRPADDLQTKLLAFIAAHPGERPRRSG